MRFTFFLFVVLFFCAGCLAGNLVDGISAVDEKLLDDISRASFMFFWNKADENSGLVRDRSNNDVCSVASLGFGLAVLPVGVERGYVTREAGCDRALRALKSLAGSNAQHNGMYCHFIDLKDGNTTQLGYESIASSIDTALMVAGAIVAGEYFEGEVKELAEKIYRRVDWQSFVDPDNGQIYMAWLADDSNDMNGAGAFDKQTWDWYTDETLLIVLLGQGAPESGFRLKTETMVNWNRPVGKYDDGDEFVYTYPGTLFTYMFAHCFYDFRATGVGPGRINWFDNTVRAVKANRNWCRDHASEYKSYGENRWGITAGSGPDKKYVVPGHEPRGARADQGKHGTLHPYGAGMSVPFLPADSIKALREMKGLKIKGQPVWQSVEDGGYGFWDGFNLDEGWVSDHVIGIAQGPMLLLIENARSELVWKLMMKNRHVRMGLKRAGFRRSLR